MDSLAQPIERVVEATQWFVATPSLRVLHVSTSGLLRVPVLRHVTATELSEQNNAPFFVLEAPVEPDDDGWALRCEELREDWAALSASAPEGVAMDTLWPACTAASPRARFALELSSALRSLRPPMRGLVIVLAPVWVRDDAAWCCDLRAVLGASGLALARFIVVESDAAPSLPVIEALGHCGERVDARIDDGALRAEMNARLDAMRAAPPGATGPQLVGAAGPPVRPPLRRNAVAPLSPAERVVRARALGVPEALFDPEVMQQLRVLILSAALAMRDGRVREGIEAQSQARDLCERSDLAKETVVNELVLAGYVLQGGDHAAALEMFGHAKRRAVRSGLADLAVQAQIAVGSCLLVAQRVTDAASAYAEGGRLGATAGAPILAVEAFRMCGQLLASEGHHEDAADAFCKALAAAAEGGEAVQAASSAPEAARALATLCRKRGLTVQAESLEAQASAIEAAPGSDDVSLEHVS